MGASFFLFMPSADWVGASGAGPSVPPSHGLLAVVPVLIGLMGTRWVPERVRKLFEGICGCAAAAVLAAVYLPRAWWPGLDMFGIVVLAAAVVAIDRKFNHEDLVSSEDASADFSPSQSRQIRRVLSRIAAKGDRVLRAFVKNPSAEAPLLRWERWAERRIRRSPGAEMVGLFAMADQSVDGRTVPAAIEADSAAADTWDRIDRKIRWLRHHIKSGPYL
jgi:hypothetical protein